MALANRYGIDLGGIYQTANAVKNARIARKLKEREMEKEDAVIEGKYNSLNAKSNIGADVGVDQDTENGSVMASAKDTQNNDNGSLGDTSPSKTDISKEKPSRKNMIATLAKDTMDQELAKRELIAKQKEARKRMYVAQGLSEQDADYKSSLDVEEVTKFQDMFQKSDEYQRKAIKENINDTGNFMASLIEMQDNPVQADKIFRDRREQRLEYINELRKKGLNKEADEIEQRVKAMPKTILTQDGKLNTQLITNELTKLTLMARTIDENQEIRKDERELKNTIIKAKEKAKFNAPKVVTEGGQDIRYEADPKTGRYKEVSRSKSNNILKEVAKGKGKGGGSGANDRGMLSFINKSIKNYFPYDVVKGVDGDITYKFKNEADAELADRIRDVAIAEWEKAGKPLNYAPFVTRAMAKVAPDKAPKTSRKMGTATVKDGQKAVYNNGGKKIPITYMKGKGWVDPDGKIIIKG